MRCSLLVATLALAALPARADVSFTHDVAPVLLRRCTGCHGDRANLGGYRAHTYQLLLKPGASGAAAVVSGKPEASRLYRLIAEKNPNLRMPKKDDPLSPEQVGLIRRWIAGGARFDGADPAAPLKSLLGPRQHPAAPAVYRASVPVLALALAPGGKEVFTGGYHEVTVWNAATGALVRRLQHLPQRIQSLALSPDGSELLVAGGTPGEYGEVCRVDPATGARKKILETTTDIVLAAVYSADGKRVAAGGAEGGVRLYETETGKRLWSSRVHSDWVTSVAFSPDGRFVASASKDMTVKVYEAGDGALYTTYGGHNRQIGEYRGQSPVYAVRFLPGSTLAASAGGGRWVQLWDPVKAREEAGDAGDMEERFAKQGHARYLEHGFRKEVYALTARNGQLFAAAADGTLKQFDLAAGKEVRAYPGAQDWLFALDYDPESRRVAAGAYNGEVRVWDTRTGDLVVAFRAKPGSSRQ